MSNHNGTPRHNALWYLVNALAREAGGGVCKRVTLVAYFDAKGDCFGHEEIKVTKLFPNKFFDILTRNNIIGGDLD